MTEDTGFAEPGPESVEPVPVADQRAAGVPPEETVTIADQRAGVPAPDLPAEPAAADAEPAPEPAAGVSEPPEPAPVPEDSPTANAPEPMPPPDLPDQGVPAAIRDALNYLHERLVRLGG